MNFNYLKKSTFLPFVLIVCSIFMAPHFLIADEANTASRKWTPEEIIELGYVPDEVIVKFKENKLNLKTPAGRKKAEDFIVQESASVGGDVLRKLKNNPEKAKHFNSMNGGGISNLENNFLREESKMVFMNGVLLKLSVDDSVEETIEELKRHPDVESVTPNYVFDLYSYAPTENDYGNGNLWGLDNSGATLSQSIAINSPSYTTNNPGNSGSDIQMEEAWVITTGGTGKIIAILDTGLAISHSDFTNATPATPNLWDGSSCVDENGDSISGGCPNHGWDYENGNNTVEDGRGHGTHIAGIIGGLHNNGGIAGINKDVTIMVVKVGTHFPELAAVLSGIAFARENGADIINASWGSHDRVGLKEAIEEFMDEGGGLFIAGSGNDTNNNDDGLESYHLYPSDYTDFSEGVADNLISVAGTDQADAMYSKSNYGSTSVDLAAPGTNILSSFVEITTHLNQNFVSDSSGFDTLGGNWDWVAEALYVDEPDYDADVAGTEAVTDTFDLTDTLDETAVLGFDVWCDTQSSGDYLDVYVAATGESDHQLNVSAINELNPLLDKSIQIYYNSTYYQGKTARMEYAVSGDYIATDTHFKFVWRTDNGSNSGYRGCYIDNVTLSEANSEDKYEYLNGTSMSTAFVTGVAALVWNAYPDLTATQVKQIIMDSGDAVADLHPVTGGHPIKSGKRLNAHKALLMAADVNDQVQAGQGLILYPTIHSKTTGGNWNSTSTWEEGRVPNSSDVVELDGDVTLNTNATIAGLLIKSGDQIINQYGTSRNLYITGDIVNNGDVKDDTSGYALFMRPQGNIENNGSWLSRYTYLEGTGSRSYTGTNPISSPSNGEILVTTDFTVTGNSKLGGILRVTTGSITVDSPNSLSFYGDLINVSGGILGDGVIKLSGNAQNFGGGDVTTSELIIEGTGVKTMTSGMTLNGNLAIGENATLVNKYSTSTHFHINGDTVNNGTITDDSSGYALFMRSYGSVVNNGGWTPRYTYLESAETRSFTGTTPIGAPSNGQVYAQGSFTVTGDSQLGGPLTINGTMTIPDSLTFTGDLYINTGSIAGTGSIVLGGSNQSFGGGTVTTEELILGNSGTKTMTANMTLSGDLTIDEDITLINKYATSTYMTVGGTITNNGTITDDSSGYALFMRPQGHMYNNTNEWDSLFTYADWDIITEASSYDFQITADGPGAWGSITSTGTSTFANIKPYVEENRQWRWRSIVGGTPSEWSEARDIN